MIISFSLLVFVIVQMGPFLFYIRRILPTVGITIFSKSKVILDGIVCVVRIIWIYNTFELILEFGC